MTIHPSDPDYDSTVGAVARFQREYSGSQPGDPAKAAAVIIQVAGMDDPPLRLLLGSDAAKLAEQIEQSRMESDRKWRHLSLSTDFDDGGVNGTPQLYPWERDRPASAHAMPR
jgi:hypothetical protein